MPIGACAYLLCCQTMRCAVLLNDSGCVNGERALECFTATHVRQGLPLQTLHLPLLLMLPLHLPLLLLLLPWATAAVRTNWRRVESQQIVCSLQWF